MLRAIEKLLPSEIPVRVLMDSWYASMKIIKMIEKAEKIYYCPLKSNRQVTEKETDGPRKPKISRQTKKTYMGKRMLKE